MEICNERWILRTGKGKLILKIIILTVLHLMFDEALKFQLVLVFLGSSVKRKGFNGSTGCVYSYLGHSF